MAESVSSSNLSAIREALEYVMSRKPFWYTLTGSEEYFTNAVNVTCLRLATYLDTRSPTDYLALLNDCYSY